jgi:alpha-mannosidase
VSPNQGLVFLKDTSAAFALFNKGLYEVEAVDNKSRTLALTLFRSFSKEVGRNEGDFSKLQRSLKFEYAVYIGTGDETKGRLMRETGKFRAGIHSACDLLHKGSLPLQQSFVQIDIPGAVISCLKKSEDGKYIVLRLYNCEDTAVAGTVQFAKSMAEACRLDLKEAFLDRLDVDGDLSLQLKPKEIITLGIVFGG